MSRSGRILWAAALLLLAGWVVFKLFPGDERVIRARLNQLARTVSLQTSDKLLTRAAKARKVPEFFDRDAVINVSAVAPEFQNIAGRDQISELALGAQAQVQQLEVKFLDITIDQLVRRQSAVVNLTVVVDLNGEKNVVVQELRIALKNVEKEWLITQIETIKTLR